MFFRYLNTPLLNVYSEGCLGVRGVMKSGQGGCCGEGLGDKHCFILAHLLDERKSQMQCLKYQVQTTGVVCCDEGGCPLATVSATGVRSFNRRHSNPTPYHKPLLKHMRFLYD
ncbi:hypothetical protein J6590_045898 [Homalodisca vitripennis]|nr:hypothetical protein J6590_045898 [Homalodisca vitripennis]